jgi:argininosuccinate lyase
VVLAGVRLVPRARRVLDGSSLLPQKRNPDVFELARGKSAR